MKKGFTMLEMIIVITVIIVIFLLTIPNIQQVLKIVHDSGCEAQIKIVDSAIVQYKLKNDDYPGTIGDLISEGLLSEKQSRCQNNNEIYISDGQAYSN